MPVGYRGVIFLAPVHSQMNMHTCAKFGPDRYPLGLDMLICLADVHSQMNLHACVKLGPDRRSGLRQERR